MAFLAAIWRGIVAIGKALEKVVKKSASAVAEGIESTSQKQTSEKKEATDGATGSFLSNSSKKVKENPLASVLFAILLDVFYGLYPSIFTLILTAILSIFLVGFIGQISWIRLILPAPWNLIPFYTLGALVGHAKSSSSESSKDKKPFFQFSATSFIVLIVIVGLIAFNWQNIPSLLTKGQVASSELSKGGLSGVLANTMADIKSWFSLQYGFKQPKVEEKQPSGIKIQDFKPSKSYFEEGQSVLLRARVHIDALPKDDATVKFYCESEGNEGEIVVSKSGDNTLHIQSGKSTDTSVVCEIKRGLNAGDGKEITRKAKLTSLYENFATKSAVKVYTLAEESYEEVGTKDPFDYFGVEESLLSQGNQIKSQCVSGCGLTLLSLRISAAQPLTPAGRYFLDINLQKDRDWYGEIKEVNEIKVISFPDSISFKGCDKAIVVEGGQPGDASEINNLIKDKQSLEFSCEFEVTNPDVKLGENVGQFVVEANYDYAVESLTTVNIKPATNPITANTFISDLINGESPLAEVLK